jgi:hypothetical protein
MSRDNVDTAPPPTAVRVIAVLLVVVSLELLSPEVTQGGRVESWIASLGADPVLGFLELATSCAGIVTAIGLWSAKRWALGTYLMWLVLYLGVVLIADSRIEPVVWKRIAGAAAAFLIPVGVAAYLHRRLR